MRVNPYHLRRTLGREGGELLYGLGRDAVGRLAGLSGDGARAVLAQADRIRHVRWHRESMAAYARLDRLMARHGDAGTGLDVDAALPQTFVCFVGHSRSGHSLVGSLLDAHPDAVIAHELHAMKHLAAGHGFVAVARALRQNARIFHLLGRRYTGYDYVVPGQHQGHARRLTVLGDKKGGGTARLFHRDPAAAERAEAAVPVPVTYVNVVRNPYDNIATKSLRTGQSVEAAARRFLDNARAIDALKARADSRVIDVHLDSLLASPDAVLAHLIDRLGLERPAEDYFTSCRELLFASPRRTRDRVAWAPGLVQSVDRELAPVPWLAGYAGSFADTDAR